MPKARYFLKKTVKIVAALGFLPPNPRWPLAAGAPPQSPCCCSHMLLQLPIQKLGSSINHAL